ncbi:MAG TPA: tRNA uridine-5-carboxymethylaminomethyl(34) synthesis GTPase MnmE [Candidatus Alistipes merdavium]|nr:tRNA uridine-5-carboxymethylaminomethyl(34) synthesis GTPase MnmE [Candidatus Alistipes merdavium]
MTGADHDTIVAPATAPGGALAVVRVSGAAALAVCDRIFRGRGKLADAAAYTLHYGRIVEPAAAGLSPDADAPAERTIDDVLVAVFRAPHSYTGEESAEISCHGSQYIISEVLRLLCRAGARMASPGEFTIRAYLNGKMDLSQAEAVADLIASSSRAAHTLATTQLRGGYSADLEALRERLLELVSLLELELDFSEEEVEFADRTQLRETMEQIDARIEAMRRSFTLGNAIKQGVAVAIVGAPNAGKSTLLNRLLNEERALVSDIAGTTRDVIEERTNIDGVEFRFLDTAGIRTTEDRLERMGIERTLSSIARAQIIIRLLDASQAGDTIPAPDFEVRRDQRLLTVMNKLDCCPDRILPEGVLGLSAKTGEGLDTLRCALRAAVDTQALYHGDTVVSNSRHAEALTAAHDALLRALDGLREGLPTDLLSEEIRQVIGHIGTITGRGQITPDEVLQNIFSKFCIGK